MIIIGYIIESIGFFRPFLLYLHPKCFHNTHKVHSNDSNNTKEYRYSESEEYAFSKFLLSESVGNRCLHYIVRHNGNEDSSSCNHHTDKPISCITRVGHIDSIYVGKSRDDRETIVRYLRWNNIFECFTYNREELDNHNESCELHGRYELKWTLIFLFFSGINWGSHFSTRFQKIMNSHSRKSYKHDSGRNPNTIENCRVNNCCNDNHTKKHNTRGDKSSYNICITMFRMLVALFCHGNRSGSRRYNSTDRTSCEDASLWTDNTREDKSGIFYTCHNHNKEPDSPRIKKSSHENRTIPSKGSTIEPMDHIHNWKLSIREERKNHESNYSKFQWITKLFTWEFCLEFCKCVFRWKNNEHENSESHSNSHISTHHNNTDNICEECCIFARDTHSIFWKRWICIGNNYKNSWYQESADFPEFSFHHDVHPCCDGTKEREERIGSDATKSCSSSYFDTTAGHLSFCSDECSERYSNNKIPKKYLIHGIELEIYIHHYNRFMINIQILKINVLYFIKIPPHFKRSEGEICCKKY